MPYHWQGVLSRSYILVHSTTQERRDRERLGCIYASPLSETVITDGT